MYVMHVSKAVAIVSDPIYDIQYTNRSTRTPGSQSYHFECNTVISIKVVI